MSMLYISDDKKVSLKYEVVGVYVVLGREVFRDGWLVCHCMNYAEALAFANILTIEGKKHEPVRRRKSAPKKKPSNKKRSNSRVSVR